MINSYRKLWRKDKTLILKSKQALKSFSKSKLKVKNGELKMVDG
jgi:hypothetical protein